MVVLRVRPVLLPLVLVLDIRKRLLLETLLVELVDLSKVDSLMVEVRS